MKIEDLRIYRVINENIEKFFKKKELEIHFKNYNELMELYRICDVSNNEVFQRKYKSFYAMGRKSKEFYNKYFDVLEKNKRNQRIDLEAVMEELFKINKRYEISFSSKLIHTINPQKPIVDGNISKFYKVSELNSKEKDERIKNSNKVYEFLSKEYERILKEKLLNKSIVLIREK